MVPGGKSSLVFDLIDRDEFKLFRGRLAGVQLTEIREALKRLKAFGNEGQPTPVLVSDIIAQRANWGEDTTNLEEVDHEGASAWSEEGQAGKWRPV